MKTYTTLSSVLFSEKIKLTSWFMWRKEVSCTASDICCMYQEYLKKKMLCHIQNLYYICIEIANFARIWPHKMSGNILDE